jgi:hypothetical protein
MESRKRPIAALVFVAATLIVALVFALRPSHPLTSSQVSLEQVLRLKAEKISQLSISRLNVLCAAGIAGGDVPSPETLESNLCAWAKHIQAETERHHYRFERNPAEFENSEDFNVHYDEQRRSDPSPEGQRDGFFAEPKSVFLTGLLGPERRGTCSSLPVLYVAVGRELGYPLKLVTAKAHMFVRWEGAGERFNIEAAGDHGVNRFPDDYYRHWPLEVTPEEEQAEGYLKSLTPAEELAVFLSIRGMCLKEQGRIPEAAEAFASAARLAPDCHSYREMAARLNQHHVTDRRF